MNPHFVFNSLNVIQQFIITNDNEKAQLYLSKFSRLIRKLLESNTRDTINLLDEIDILEKYLEIESLRFDHVFKPVIEVENDLSSTTTFIPIMLIQPFVENAIWHGLIPQKKEKKLTVKFELLDDKTLYCTIDDNGIGRKPLKEINPNKTRSLGIQFIQQRLELLSKIYKKNYYVRIIDKKSPTGESDGTTVVLTIPIFKN
jgi:LytS/YehU family sensor histidine kinase